MTGPQDFVGSLRRAERHLAARAIERMDEAELLRRHRARLAAMLRGTSVLAATELPHDDGGALAALASEAAEEQAAAAAGRSRSRTRTVWLWACAVAIAGALAHAAALMLALIELPQAGAAQAKPAGQGNPGLRPLRRNPLREA